MRNTGLVEAQAGIKIARRNINNLRYTDDTTLMAESEEISFCETNSYNMKTSFIMLVLNGIQVRKQQLELDMEQQIGSK